MIPDIDLLLPGYRSFHALEGLVILLPLALVFVILFDNKLAPKIATAAQRPHLGIIAQVLNYCGMEAWDMLASKRFTTHWLIRALFSAVIGILSHFTLDLPTHDWISYLRPFFDGPMPSWFLYSYGFVNIPVFGVFAVTRARILQWVFSVGFGVAALYCLRYMKKRQLLAKLYRKQPNDPRA
jgi:hypothetical protein